MVFISDSTGIQGATYNKDDTTDYSTRLCESQLTCEWEQQKHTTKTAFIEWIPVCWLHFLFLILTRPGTKSSSVGVSLGTYKSWYRRESFCPLPSYFNEEWTNASFLFATHRIRIFGFLGDDKKRHIHWYIPKEHLLMDSILARQTDREIFCTYHITCCDDCRAYL